MKGLLLLLCFVVFSSAAVSFQVNFIVRPNRTLPSGNSYVVYDDHQVLVVDVGRTENDASEVYRVVDPLVSSRSLRIFLTHGHPDHVSNVPAFSAKYPQAQFFVATSATKTELIQLLKIFSVNDTRVSSFDFNARLAVPTNASQLWSSTTSQLRLHTSHGIVAETLHYGWLELSDPAAHRVAIFSGDLVSVRSHLFMGYDVSLLQQCDWIIALQRLQQYLSSLAAWDVYLYPGHGPADLPDADESIQMQLQYLAFARNAYATSCTPSAASAAILKKFPSFAEPILVSAFSAPARVPGDILLLNPYCCKNPDSPCQVQVPPCVTSN